MKWGLQSSLLEKVPRPPPTEAGGAFVAWTLQHFAVIRGFNVKDCQLSGFSRCAKHQETLCLLSDPVPLVSQGVNGEPEEKELRQHPFCALCTIRAETKAKASFQDAPLLSGCYQLGSVLWPAHLSFHSWQVPEPPLRGACALPFWFSYYLELLRATSSCL